MLRGTADLDALAHGAPTLEVFASVPIELGDVALLQVVAELRRPAREALLPSGLHPTDPPALVLQAWRVGSSPWGPFTMVLARLSCRSGVRARGFSIAGVCDGDDAREALVEGWGYPLRAGHARLDVRYDGATLEAPRLGVLAVDPRPIGGDDVQYTGTMNLAHTPVGLRLVQVEAHPTPQRAERLHGRITDFSATEWGSPLLDPYHVVATTLVRGAATLAPVRFVCRPDLDAFSGTERVG
ncbi:MAG TPA: hypothetical protein VF855_01315 [Acidimicrobiales bacterium]